MIGPTENRDEQDKLIASIRQKLDTDGLGDRFIDMYRKKDKDPFGDYYVILAGVMMLRCGARIKDEDLQYLREMAAKVHCVEGYASPLADFGFRGPGKQQFLAALDHYQPGEPRSFDEPSCFACGKIAGDIDKRLDKCSRCQAACYCNKDCQKAHWSAHKSICRPVGSSSQRLVISCHRRRRPCVAFGTAAG
ncbi:hypothetical protein GE09DRAFT_982214 [Coniochaeta sp. 2T2.1]|nr:hypothetical protein GE09DRAFT_982214 [Coniochaeta sp. 2T2.1]